MANPKSIRLSDEVRNEFELLTEQSGMKQEDFVATLLVAFKERQVDTDTASPVYRESIRACFFIEIHLFFPTFDRYYQ